jgi:nucleoside phosphorylase
LKIASAILAPTVLFIGSTFADTAILVALPSEQSALSREVRIVGQPVEMAQHRISIGYHRGEKLYIVRTGAGNLNSAMVTQALLTRYRIDRVISIGVAGNLADEEGGSGKGEGRGRIGDIFIATEVVSHQEGKETPGGFEVKQGQPSVISHQRSAEYEQRCAELRSNVVEVARKIIEDGRPKAEGGEAAAPARTNNGGGQAESDETPSSANGRPTTTTDGGKRDARPTNLWVGRLVSGESFIASTAKRKWLRETFKADAVDMVSVGIARVCEANGVPYVIIRVLSDNADESASAAFASFVQDFKEPVTVPITLALVERFAAALTVPSHRAGSGEP